MALEQGNVAIPCEYVYETETKATQKEASFLNGPYYDESSDADDVDPPKENNCRDNKSSRASKTKRRSSYDEDMYAMLEPLSPEEARLGTLEYKARMNKKKISTWRKISMVFLGILLMSLAANVYFTVDKLSPGGKIIIKF